jgi:tRNA A37 threonylcarbamoyladenosine dehydratase
MIIHEVPHWLERTALLIGNDAISNLHNKNILLVGLGGVGSFAAEFLVRAGVGNLTIVDGDTVDTTNRNRQLPALSSTVGISKAKIMEARIKDINPAINLTVIEEFLTPERTVEVIQQGHYNYVLDCIDSVTPKVNLIAAAINNNCKIISSMGAGGQVDSLQVKYADISKTYNCPFAALVRKRLKNNGIKNGVITVFSTEVPNKKAIKETDGSNFKKSYYGTISYIPALFGLHMASWIIQDIINESKVEPLPIVK